MFNKHNKQNLADCKVLVRCYLLLAICDPGGGTLGEADIEQSAPLGVNSTLAVNSSNTDT